MKKRFSFLIHASFLSSTLIGNQAWAHTEYGSLPAAAETADVYQVNCQAGTAILEAQVRNATASGPLLQLQISKGGTTVSTTDPISGDSSYSPFASLSGGVGAYDLKILKAAAGNSNYTFEFHCMNGSTHTDTDITIVENDVSYSAPVTPPPVVTPTPVVTPPPVVVTPPGTPPVPRTVSSVPVLTNSIAQEGTTLYTGISLNVECNTGNASKRIIAQSVLFPTENPNITRSDNTESIALADVLTTATIANLPQLIQSRQLFNYQLEKKDTNGNVIGFDGVKGRATSGLVGMLPFRLGGMNFLPTSCAKKLTIKLAVAEVCANTFPPQSGTANIWIPSATPLFAESNIGVGESPSLTVERNLISNPLPVSCNDGFDVTIEPSSQDIDNNLPISLYWHN